MTQVSIAADNPNRRPLHPDITEELVEALVTSFYAKIRDDERLGPIFQKIIGDDWAPHLRRMVDFWSSVTRMTGRYKGKPMVAHMQLKEVRPEDFEIWLSIFRSTTRELMAEDAAKIFIERAERIAESLKLAMFIDPAGNKGS